jgi:hypothetical protein
MQRNYRQGDVPLIPFVADLPDFQEVKAEDGKLTLALGEATGHHHRIEGSSFSFGEPDNHRLYRDPMTGAHILEVGGGGASLLHEEHSTIDLAPGRYLQLIQVEDDGEMISQVID